MPATGTVKCYYPDKGFGFITPDVGGKDLFVHVSMLKRIGLSAVEPGTKLLYDVDDNPVHPVTGQPLNKGPRAVNVALVN